MATDRKKSAQLRLATPRSVFRSVPARPHGASHGRMSDAGRSRKAHQGGAAGVLWLPDATLILIAFRHGLRASEICDLEWSQVEFGRTASLHVRRAKNGKPSVHTLRGDEIRALRELQRQFPESKHVFGTERGGPFTPDAVNRLI